MFWGEYSHQLDSKGRLIIPARFRSLLPEGTMLTRGLDRNLVLYPQTTWQTLTHQLNAIPLTHPTGRAVRRLLFAGAIEIEFDKQGRILIPPYLREYASLAEEALVIGMETFIEIWEPSQWRSALSDVSGVLADSGHLFKLG